MTIFIVFNLILTIFTAVVLVGLYNKNNNHPVLKTQKLLIASSYVISQVTTSWMIEKVMFIAPNKPSLTYLITIFLIFSFISAIFINELKLVLKTFIQGVKNNYFFTIIIIFTSIIIIFISINLPVDSNDPLEYIQVAKNISETGNFNHYPLINSELLKGYFPWSHPSGYVGMIVWSFNFTENINDFMLLKLYNPLIAISFLIIFYIIFSGTNIYLRTILSFIGVLATPLLIIEVFHFHIDPLRIFTFFITGLLALELYKMKSIAQYILLGFLLGITLHSHSLGILIIPMFFGILAVDYYQTKQFYVKPMCISLFVTLIFVGFRYYINFNTLGYIVGDNTPLWKIESLNFSHYLQLTRGLETPSNKILNGLLKVFTHIYSFGVTFWIYTLLFTKSFLTKKEKFLFNFSSYETVSNFIILFWFLGSTTVTLMGSDILIKNDRYTLTIFPFVLISTCMMLKRAILKESEL
ncbi:MAG: hypothetical protein QF441_03860 [Bacteriovoracaceae bacterium]|jgi:hypothetical protein|nr:hypothetical protein [Bacteriovoracaceae bacterium]